jgi:hypothetical protein
MQSVPPYPTKGVMPMILKCAKCGRDHEVSDLSWDFDRPLQWDLLSEEQRAASELGEEQCVIESEGTHFFIRACLEIPVKGRKNPLVWGVLCSLSEQSFLEVSERREDPKRVELGPHFGRLCSKLPWYPDTMFLKTRIHQKEVGTRPLVELEHTDHSLSVHQREGIDQALLMKIVAEILHPDAQATADDVKKEPNPGRE